MFTELFLSKTIYNADTSSRVIYRNTVKWRSKTIYYPVFKRTCNYIKR